MKIETSKIFLFIIAILSIIVTVFSVWFCYKYETYEPLCYIVPAIFTELGAATAGYYWKSKNENKIKMTLGAVKEISEYKELNEEQIRIVEALVNTLG
jgi:hypothetical protein